MRCPTPGIFGEHETCFVIRGAPIQTATVQTARPYGRVPRTQDEWICIVAFRLARRKPELSQHVEIKTAIEEFDEMGDLLPDEADELYRGHPPDA